MPGTANLPTIMTSVVMNIRVRLPIATFQISIIDSYVLSFFSKQTNLFLFIIFKFILHTKHSSHSHLSSCSLPQLPHASFNPPVSIQMGKIFPWE